MFPIYFEYEEETRSYVYKEKSVEYRMPLALMLKFKKYYRAEPQKLTDKSMEKWFSTLAQFELSQVIITELTV